MVNIRGGEMETSSLDQENNSNAGEADEEGEDDDEEEDDDDDIESKYDPQTVTVPLTLCCAIMVG